jgi:hypothetical protein
MPCVEARAVGKRGVWGGSRPGSARANVLGMLMAMCPGCDMSAPVLGMVVCYEP